MSCGKRVEDPFLNTTLTERYRVDSLIAIGGFGTVYRGYDLATRRDIAIKVMHAELAFDENLVARFRREAAVLGRLRDPHIVETYDFGQAPDGRLFIVMELLDGRTLYDELREVGMMAWRRILGIVRQVCSALMEAHRLGVVHRDLKPANIYLEHGDAVKVLDFGIAKMMEQSLIDDHDELTRMGQAVGTVEYMAPEQLMGGKFDASTDFYTLAVVAYEAITGRRPYGSVGLDLLTEQVSRTPQPPSQLAPVPREVDALLLRCLDADVDRRYRTAADLARAIDALLAMPDEEAAVVAPAIELAASREPVRPRAPSALPAMPMERPRIVRASQPPPTDEVSARLPVVRPTLRGGSPPRARARWNPFAIAFVIVVVVVGAAVALALVLE